MTLFSPVRLGNGSVSSTDTCSEEISIEEKSDMKTWGRSRPGMLHFLFCSQCEEIVDDETESICAKGHIICNNCSDTLRSCPYRHTTTGIMCRLITAKFTTPFVQQKLTQLILHAEDEAEEEVKIVVPDIQDNFRDVLGKLPVSELEALFAVASLITDLEQRKQVMFVLAKQKVEEMKKEAVKQ